MIYVITAVHNRINITEKFIENFAKQKEIDKHLILIDDGSTDGTRQLVEKRIDKLTILEGDGNLWWGGALNLAYHWICNNANNEDYILIANDDISFDENYFKNGILLLKEYKNTLIAGCGYSENGNKLSDSAFIYDFKSAKSVGSLYPNGIGNCASTRSLFLTVHNMKKIGGFRPKLLPHYFSDYEWTLRASRKGLTIRSFEELRYLFEVEYTNNKLYSKKDLNRMFTKKSNINPLRRIVFILISTPLKYIPLSLYSQFKRYTINTINIINNRNKS